MTKLYELYTPKQLSAGASHFRLSVEQERRRLEIIRTPKSLWPSGLKEFLLSQHTALSVDGVTKAIADWLRTQNTAVSN